MKKADKYLARIERLVVGALQSAITAHGPITSELIGSAAKRVVGQLAASSAVRLPVPVMTARDLDRIERISDRFEALRDELMDGVMYELVCDLSVLRGENHPEGWTEIEVVEHADTPFVVKHHYTVGKAPKEYRRKRDGKRVELQPSVDAVDPVGEKVTD